MQAAPWNQPGFADRLITRLIDLLATPLRVEQMWCLARHDDARDRVRVPLPRAHVIRSGFASIFVALLVMVAGGACSRRGEVEIDPHAPPVRIDGSSTVFLVSRAVAEEVAKEGIKATVHGAGTTAGFKKLCRGELDVAGASRPIERDEMDECKRAGVNFIELPIGYDGLAVVVNVANNWVDHLTVGELRTMWAPEAAGAVTSWKQVRASFPDRPLRLFGPGGDSGTFDYFTQAVLGKQRASRRDYAQSEDDTVLVRGVSEDANALGYFGYAYVRNQNRLRVVPIDDGDRTNGDGPIAPSAATVANGTYQPLSRPIFIYVNAESAKRPEVDQLVTFYLNATRALSPEIGYVALPLRVVQLATERYRARRTGTMFDGAVPPIGVTVEQLLAAQAK